MGSRTFNTAVVLMWLAAMSWLVKEKVLPPLQVGTPPNYKAILKKSDQPPVCWAIYWNDQPVGFAASIVVTRKDNMREIHSRVFFSQLPIDQMAPGWLAALVRPLLSGVGALDMDAQSRLEIDPLDHLVGFESKVRLASIKDAIRINGNVEGTQLKLAVQSGDVSFRREMYLPPDALVGDELSPQAQLPGLTKGQTWTMPVYSPFRPPNSPMEILQASVDRHDTITWDGKSHHAWLVVYRNDKGSALTSPREPRGRLWVRSHDGMVIKQEINVFNSRLYFLRLTPDDGEKLIESLGDTLGPDWTGDLSSDRANEIWGQLTVHENGMLKSDRDNGSSRRRHRYRGRRFWTPTN